MTTKTSSSTQVYSGTGAFRSVVLSTAFAIVAVSVANLLFYWLMASAFTSVAGWSGANEGSIIGASITYLLIGGTSLFLVRRFSQQPRRAFIMVAIIGLILSMWPPISAGLGYVPPSAASIPMVITLAMMHLIAFGISMPIFLRMGLSD